MTNTDDQMARYEEKMRSLNAHPNNLSRVELPLSEEDLKEIERQLDIQLPPDYRLFLSRYNSYMTSARIPLRDYPSTLPTVWQWLHFTPNAIDTSLVREVYWEDGPVPVECFVIVTTFRDSPFCLVVRGEHIGEVRFLDYEDWGMEKPEPDEQPGVEDLPFVASSFEEFFFALQPLHGWD